MTWSVSVSSNEDARGHQPEQNSSFGRDRKLVLAYALGDRPGPTVFEFMNDLRPTLQSRAPSARVRRRG